MFWQISAISFCFGAILCETLNKNGIFLQKKKSIRRILHDKFTRYEISIHYVAYHKVQYLDQCSYLDNYILWWVETLSTKTPTQNEHNGTILKAICSLACILQTGL